jgi:AraC-like DNA-binding protein
MYWKAPQSASGFPCMLPSVLDVTFAEGQRHIIVLIDLSHLRSTLDAEVFSALETAASTRLLPAAPHDASAFGGWLLGLLRQVRTRPEILRHPEAVRSIETDLIYRPATAVYPHTRGLVRIRQPRRATGLDRALEYLRTQHPGDVGVMQLSKAAALSQRSLERAFQDRFDMTARDFLCLRRHHAVRRVLMAARKGETSVAAVAYEHGFYELGRFAGNYFRMFGERPSETLAREFPGLPRGIRPEIE